MRAWIHLIVVLALAGCKKNDVPPDNPASVVPIGETEVEEVDPREDPDARGSERLPDEPDPETLTACEAYARCCFAYFEALADTEGVPGESIEAAKEGCKSVENLATHESGQESCAMALDAMRQGIEAMESMPGFIPPVECL
jgi:hypothetical protein